MAAKTPVPPYYNHENITVLYELDWQGHTIHAGDAIHLKWEKGVFKFRCLAYNRKTDTSWLDCMHNANGSWHSFPVDKLKGPVVKKSRRRK